jgi:hypothetical protein
MADNPTTPIQQPPDFRDDDERFTSGDFQLISSTGTRFRINSHRLYLAR